MLQKIRGQWIDPEKVCTLEVQDVIGSSEPVWTRVCFNSGMTAVPGTVDEVAGEINAALRDRVYRGQVGQVVGDLGLREKILASKDVGMVAMTHARQCDGPYHWKERGAARCQCGQMEVALPPLPERPELVRVCRMLAQELRVAWTAMREPQSGVERLLLPMSLVIDFMRAVRASDLPPLPEPPHFDSSGAHPLQCEGTIGAMRCQLMTGHDGLHVPFRGPKCGKTWTEYGLARSCVLEAGHIGGCLENYASVPKEGVAPPNIDEELRCQQHEHFQMAGWTQCLCGELTGLDVAPYDQLRVNPRPVLQSDPPTLAQRLLNKEELSDKERLEGRER